MMTNAVTIDGDLSDWGDLQHPLAIRWRGDTADEAFDSDITAYMRWNQHGIYLAYRSPGTPSYNPSARDPFSGEACEIWVEPNNSRVTSLQLSQSGHQFIFHPLNNALFEAVHGQRHQERGNYRFPAYRTPYAALKTDNGFYTVETFLPRSALATPMLIPGHIWAINISINQGTRPPTALAMVRKQRHPHLGKT